MNFLIAIIAQSFEEMMTQQLINKYSHRAEMNRECRLNLQSFGVVEKIDCMTIQADNSINESTDWQGFVMSIKKAVQNETNRLKKRL